MHQQLKIEIVNEEFKDNLPDGSYTENDGIFTCKMTKSNMKCDRYFEQKDHLIKHFKMRHRKE